MSFSIDKLCTLLYSKGFISKNFYQLNKYCVFIQIMSLKTAEYFMLYIPSKYKFRIDNYESYKLKYIKFDKEEKNEILNDYAGEPDGNYIENDYDALELDSEYIKKDLGNIESRLEEHYKKFINLKDLQKEDHVIVKCIFRQLRRFKYCVQNLRYKLVICYKQYICLLHSNDDISCFYIKKFPIEGNNYRKIYITVDLELLYENIDVLYNDLQQVKSGIKKILDRNHLSHAKSLQYMLEQKSEVISITDRLYLKKEKLRNYTNSFRDLLSNIITNEQIIIQKKAVVEEKKNVDSSKGGLKYDIKYSHEIKRLENELNHVQHIKKKISEKIQITQNQEEHLSLIIDKILFDNTVMLDKIFKNLEVLSEIG